MSEVDLNLSILVSVLSINVNVYIFLLLSTMLLHGTAHAGLLLSTMVRPVKGVMQSNLTDFRKKVDF